MLQTKIHVARLIKFFALLTFFFFSISPAGAHVEEGNMPDSVAEMEYRILLEFEPDNHDARLRLGMILFRSEKYDEAADEFNYILDKDPENSEALISLARVKIKLHDYQHAISLLQKAMSLAPDDMHTYYYLGQALEMQGSASKAASVYQRGLDRKISPENRHAAEEKLLLIEAMKNLQKPRKQTLGQN
jgi:tetratricopeptide (TPR) repeat protein